MNGKELMLYFCGIATGMAAQCIAHRRFGWWLAYQLLAAVFLWIALEVKL